jgi:NAD(P)H-dependent FMN reductase
MASSRNVAVLVGSLRKGSINRNVARALIELEPASLPLGIVEIGQLPVYNQDGDASHLSSGPLFANESARRTHSSLSPRDTIVRCQPR